MKVEERKNVLHMYVWMCETLFIILLKITIIICVYERKLRTFDMNIAFFRCAWEISAQKSLFRFWIFCRKLRDRIMIFPFPIFQGETIESVARTFESQNRCDAYMYEHRYNPWKIPAWNREFLAVLDGVHEP